MKGFGNGVAALAQQTFCLDFFAELTVHRVLSHCPILRPRCQMHCPPCNIACNMFHGVAFIVNILHIIKQIYYRFTAPFCDLVVKCTALPSTSPATCSSLASFSKHDTYIYTTHITNILHMRSRSPQPHLRHAVRSWVRSWVRSVRHVHAGCRHVCA